MSGAPSIGQMIGEARHELAMRAKVYPGLAAKPQYRKSELDLHMEQMQGICNLLEWLRAHRPEVVEEWRAAVASGQGEPR